MPTAIKARNLKFEEGEEHILRRLGGALVVHWDTLSEAQRETLLQQAIMMSDPYQTVQLIDQIKAFINQHKG